MSSGKTAPGAGRFRNRHGGGAGAIFDQGAEELEQIVSALNQRRLFDRSAVE